MAISNNNLSLRKLETKRISERMSETAKRIDTITDRLYNGSGHIPASEYDDLLAEYHTALRRYELDEIYLEQLNSKAKLTDEERERTNKKYYKGNYKY
ncbi:MAG: hypothetical protein RSO15_17115 [Bacteroides sp.]|uniref:hypothetical protein n=1 Tax=Bacteroides sp. TaxID=29523 RepID=UPI002FC78817